MKRLFIKRVLLVVIVSLIIITGVKLYSVYQLSKITDFNHRQLQLIDKNIKNFSFAVLGDNRNSVAVFTNLINTINVDNDILFIIDGGDLVGNGEKKQYMFFIDQVKGFKKPFLTVIGNHDIKNYRGYFTEENGRENYYRLFGKFYYSFVIGDAYFIILDNANEERFDSQQMRWLKRQLEESLRYKYRFIFMHVPLFDPRVEDISKGYALKDKEFAQALNSLLDQYNITMLFASHIHAYYRGKWGKTPYIITGGAGAPLSGKNPGHSFYHYIKVSVSDKGIVYEVKILSDHASIGLLDYIHNAWKYIYYFLALNYFYVMLFTIAVTVLMYMVSLWKR
jgi:3',5'-cyclic AMP phosphodiesterase CpdA